MWYSSIERPQAPLDTEASELDWLLREAKTISRPEKPKSIFRLSFLSLTLGILFLFSVIIVAFYGASTAVHEQYLQWMSSRHKHTVSVTDDAITQRPNFVFIIADDLGYKSVGYETHDLQGYTPCLTSLLKKGVVLSNYYAQEKCTPSRASLLTGRYPVRLGMQYHIVQPDYDFGLSTSEILIPEILRDEGDYINYGIGKWHIGHYSANMLPTARGFHQFFGFTGGQMYYWSKKVPEYTDFTDLTYMDTDCYTSYNGSDFEDYSTFLFRDKAIQVIQQHDYSKNPMFLYLSFQAVHVPYDDLLEAYSDGIPSTYFADGVYDSLTELMTMNSSRLHYTMSLMLLDQAVEAVVKELDTQEQLDSTYIIFVSDNGGCTTAGARNGDLRGNKGTLFEGGMKVDGFIYSPLLPESQQGTNYTNLMHVTDWLPTIMSFASIEYIASDDHEVDGVDHMLALTGKTSSSPRQKMLYNLMIDVDNQDFNLSTSGSLAVRNERYKLIHEYTGYTLANWFDASLWEGSDWGTSTCRPDLTNSVYERMLFDLENDPNEETSLYDDPDYADVLVELYATVDEYYSVTKEDAMPSEQDDDAKVLWATQDNSILPWVDVEVGQSKLSLCQPNTFFDKTERR